MSYKLTGVETYSNVETRSLINQYRTVVATRYQPCGHTEIRDVIRSSSFIVSRKIDGELWFAAIDADGAKLIAANGRTLTGSHPILDELKSLPINTVLAGELHVPNHDGRERVGDVSRALSKKGEGLAFAVFDLVTDGETTFYDSPYVSRLEHIKQSVLAGPTVHVIPTELLSGISDLEIRFNEEIIANGYEGLVVRSEDGRGYKIKTERSVDAVILGFTEREGTNEALEVRSLLLGLTQDDQFILVGVAGNIAVDVNRAELHALLKALTTPSEYRHAASTGQVYQMVKPQIIVEAKVVDIQVTDSKGLAMKQPVLSHSNSGYQAHKPVAAVTLINATAIRVRDDKQVESDGASWRQVEDVAPVVAPSSQNLVASEVIRRQVWTKGSGDKVDVRKLVVWKTNKSESDPSFPAFVVHWTDYSKGRKSPLDREVKPAPTEKSALALADKMIEENIKKGWAEVT